MPKAETSLADEILVTAAARKKGGHQCFVCTALTQEQRDAIAEAHSRGASYRAIHEHVEKKWGIAAVTFHSIRGHFGNGHTA